MRVADLIRDAGLLPQIQDLAQQLLREHPGLAEDLTFNVYGQIHPDVGALMEAAVPKANLNAGAYLPHDAYLEALYLQQVLVLLINDFPHNGGRYIVESEGYVATLVGGQIIVENGVHTGSRPGQVIREFDRA